MVNSMTSTIAFIGGGQMAEAIIGGLVVGQVCRPDALYATDPLAARCDRLKSQFGVRVSSDNRQAVAWAEVVMLAVKPQSLPEVLKEIGAHVNAKMVISIVAGTTIDAIAQQTSTKRIVRAMPNTPAVIREGMTALAFSNGVSEEDKLVARSIFEAVGRVLPVEVRLMDAVT